MTVVKYKILVKNKMYAEMCGLEFFHFLFNFSESNFRTKLKL